MAFTGMLYTGIVQDIVFAIRQLKRSPGFAVAVVVTLALGIGVNTAVFSLLNGFMLRPLPYRQPERVGALAVHREGSDPRTGTTKAEEDDSFDGASWNLLRSGITVADLASWGGSGGANLRADGSVRYAQSSRVSANYFHVLGIDLAIGREFTVDEDRPNGARVAVVSDGLWRSVLGGDRNVLGRQVDLKGEPFTVVGVLPAGVVLPYAADVFIPLRPAPTGECGGENCGILVRLKPDATWTQLNAQLSRVRLPSFEAFEKATRGQAHVYARPLADEFAGDNKGRAQVLMLSVAFILLIGCGNLAGLALVRIARRNREIATRLALGASGAALLRQLWVEALLLSLLGGGAAVLLASFLLTGLTRLMPPEMLPVGGAGIDWRVLCFGLALALLASLLFGGLPALEALKGDFRQSIVSSGWTSVPRTSRTRQWIIGAEIALAVVLLVAAGLLVRTLVHLETLPPGFDAQNVMTAKVSLDTVRYRDASALKRLAERGVEDLQTIPGVEAAAFGLSVPYERGLNWSLKVLDGRHEPKRQTTSMLYATPDYFAALRIPVLEGRTFGSRDGPNSQPMAVVNETLARRFFGERRPIGRHIELANKEFTICGVVGDVVKRPGMEVSTPLTSEPLLYVPVAQIPEPILMAHIWFQPSWIVRKRGSTEGLAKAMTAALARADGDLPVYGVYSMNQILAEQLQTQQVEVALLLGLALLALALTAVGIYATVANLVVQRTREMGVRMALGASVGQATWQIARAGVTASGLGLLAGLVCSLFVTRLLSSEIFGVQPNDPITLAAVGTLLLAVGMLASILPALRISRIDPACTLKSE